MLFGQKDLYYIDHAQQHMNNNMHMDMYMWDQNFLPTYSQPLLLVI